MTSYDEVTLAEYVTTRITALADEKGKTLEEIADAADMKSTKPLSMIATGQVRLQLDRVT